jgi:SulP family sulfate permease
MEVVAVSKTLAARTGQKLNFDQELIGQGLASLAGGVTQAFPVSGSFSRSALNHCSGARTGLAAVVSGLVVLLVLMFLTPLLYHLPRAVLGAIIVMAVAGMADFRSMFRIFRVRRSDGLVAWVTFASVLVLAPHMTEGILVGVLLALAFHLYDIMNPHVAVLGRHPDGTLRDAERHSLTVDRRILAFRFDGRLIFANASYFVESILQARAEHPDARALLVVAEGINEMDASGEDALRHLVQELRESGVEVVFAQLKSQVLDVLRASGLYLVIGEANMFRTPEAAWQELERRMQKHAG